jgi:UrcA family protein
MKSDILRLRLKHGAIAILGAMAGSVLTSTSPALAQPAPAAPPPQTATAAAITVVAPRVVRHEVSGPARFAGSPVEVLSLQRAVSFADLDLTTQDGVDEFQKRIMYGALAACDQMEAEYPSNIYVPVPANQNCPDTTARQAMAVANEIIAAARSKAR